MKQKSLTAARLDSESAFRTLAESAHLRLRNLAWRFGIPPSEVEDNVQDVLLKAWRAWHRFRGDSAADTWLYRIAVNHFISRRRQWLRRIQALSAMADAATAPKKTVWRPDRAEEYAVASACVRQLPPKLRAAFVLRYLDDMSVAETAEVLGISEVAVRRRCVLARVKLREMLDGKLE